MDIKNVIEGLGHGVKLIEAFNKPGTIDDTSSIRKIGAVLGVLSSIADNTLERINQGAVIATERERKVVEAFVTELGGANDRLASQIAKS